jgi:hypothetical protein
MLSLFSHVSIICSQDNQPSQSSHPTQANLFKPTQSNPPDQSYVDGVQRSVNGTRLSHHLRLVQLSREGARTALWNRRRNPPRIRVTWPRRKMIKSAGRPQRRGRALTMRVRSRSGATIEKFPAFRPQNSDRPQRVVRDLCRYKSQYVPHERTARWGGLLPLESHQNS